MANQLLEKYRRGQRTIGTFLNLGTGVSAECLGLAGLDYFIVDTEHSPSGLAEAADCIRGAELRGITPLVRIGEISRSSILKALDVGAKGLVIPGVKTAEEIRRIVSFGKYPPMGERGFCPTRCCGYGYDGSLSGGIGPYLEQCNRDVLLVPQCETAECLDQIEEVCGVAGVDGIFIGPFDLSIALGKPGQFGDPTLKSAFERILAACKRAGKPAFIYAPTAEAAKVRLAQGFDSVTYSMDLNVLVEAFQNVLSELRP